MFKFTPNKLLQARKEVVKQHANIGEVKDVEKDMTFVKFIKRLANLNVAEVEKEALLLTKREMNYVAGYIPYNSYNVKMTNLFRIFQLRSTEQLCQTLYNKWQNSFDYKICNLFLIDLLEKDKNFKHVIMNNHMTILSYKEILSKENVSLAFGHEANQIVRLNNFSFDHALEYFGVLKTSKLYKECVFLFFVFCEKEDYLRAGDGKILKNIRMYEKKMQIRFLKNFLRKLKFAELKRFPLLAEYFLATIGAKRTKNFESYFEHFDSVLIRKYVDWINSYTIKKLFGADERSIFWEKYHFESVTRYEYSDSVVMEFERHIGVEFLGKAMGPLYMYKKSYFEKNIRDSLRFRTYDNASLRSHLYQRRDYNNNSIYYGGYDAVRLVHAPNPGWTYTFENLISCNNITEKVSDM